MQRESLRGNEKKFLSKRIFLYCAIQHVRTEATIDVVSNGSTDGELSKRNVNQANVMRSLSPCTCEYLSSNTKIGSRLPLQDAGIGAEDDDVRRV
jgi:hypothetical protein